MKEPKSEAMERGNVIHKEAEGYVKGEGRALPKSLKLFDKEFKRLRGKFKKDPQSMVVEDNWAFTDKWGPSRWDDWKGCWVRIKLDLAEREGPVVSITDYKTGKFREDNRNQYMEQQELYGLAALLKFGQIPDLKVTVRLLYLDHGITYPPVEAPVEFAQKDLKPLQKDWMRRVTPMLKDTTFAPRPNRFCGWCHFRKDNGGPCKF
jgi:hypothetical protein